MKKTALQFFATLFPEPAPKIDESREDEIKFRVEMNALHLEHIEVLEQHIAFLQKTLQSQRETIDLQAESIRLLKAEIRPAHTLALNTRGVGIA